MPFISNAQNFTLGDGVYNNIQGDVVNNIFLGRKRHRREIDDALSPLALTFHTPKRQRMENPQPSDGLKVIRNRYLKLTHEIGSGPGYFLHAGQNKSRAVIVKVFNAAPNAREQLESTVALSKGLMHPNVLRIKAEGPLAAALKDNVTTSITLGFKMIAGLASGMNYLSLQGISLTLMRAENFDIFLDIDDRFLISINPPASVESDAVEYQEPEDTARKCWKLFNSLCQKVLRSANCVLHNENIDRSLDTIDFLGQNSVPQTSELTPDPLYPLTSDEPLKLSAPTNTAQKLPVPPRREVASTNTKNPHRCAGYIREEITLATTAMDSAVVSHDSPSPLEICTVCREVVGIHDEFQCISWVSPHSQVSGVCPLEPQRMCREHG
ncbi:hypothetical protein B0H13DRAFT_617441 [Mycena leptocephala]|nr:hypothetical protein B0H13DRAFT_617441 [Mycena leptocephala]